MVTHIRGASSREVSLIVWFIIQAHVKSFQFHGTYFIALKLEMILLAQLYSRMGSKLNDISVDSRDQMRSIWIVLK